MRTKIKSPAPALKRSKTARSRDPGGCIPVALWDRPGHCGHGWGTKPTPQSRAETPAHGVLREQQRSSPTAPVWHSGGPSMARPAPTGSSGLLIMGTAEVAGDSRDTAPGLLSPRPGSDAAPRGGRGMLSPWDVANAGRSEEEWPRSARGRGRVINTSPTDAKRAPSPSQPPSHPHSPRPVLSPQPCPIPGRWRRAVAAANIPAD